MYVLNFLNDVGNFFKDIRDWFYANYNNPLLWLGIILGIIAVFGIAYTSLHGRD